MLESSGCVVAAKARFVVGGLQQVHGLDCSETFAPLMKFPVISSLQANVVHFDLELHQSMWLLHFLIERQTTTSLCRSQSVRQELIENLPFRKL